MKDMIYLCHPCSTFGDFTVNIINARRVQDLLKESGNIVINPLDIIPENSSWNEAMNISFRLLDSCNSLVIGSGLWYYSRGCRKEVKRAMHIKPIYMFNHTNKKLEDIDSEILCGLLEQYD